MKIETGINTYAFQHNPVRSDGIGVLGSLALPLQREGEYSGRVLRDRREVGTFRIAVAHDATSTQADVDLADLVDEGAGEKNSCGCQGKDEGDVEGASIIKGGYLMLYASQGPGNFQVVVDYVPRDGEGMQVYDGHHLQRGSIFIVTLIRPGSYRMRDLAGKGEGVIEVAYPPRSEKGYVLPGPVEVKIGPEGFHPRVLNIQPTGSIVFMIETDKALPVVELVKPNDGPDCDRSRVTRWNNPGFK